MADLKPWTPTTGGGGGGGIDLETLAIALCDVVETPDGFPERPTLAGQEIPWTLKWRTLPGSETNPVDRMATYDEFRPV